MAEKGGKKITKIKIVDAPMGTGKTSAAINYMRAAPKEQRFMYVTPYLNEVQRIIDSCGKKKDFRQPQPYGTKMNGLKCLLEKGRNIVTTHVLFDHLDDRCIELIREHGYSLIMDEVTNVIEEMEVTSDDYETIIEYFAHIDDGKVVWDKISYEGVFKDCKDLAMKNQLWAYDQASQFLKVLPSESFSSFSEVYVMTYLFEAQFQKHYFDLLGMEYEPVYIKGDGVKNYQFTDEPQQYNINVAHLINICERESLNQIGADRCALSANWYKKHQDDDKIKELQNHCYNFVRCHCDSASRNVIWTTFGDYKKPLKRSGYSKGFLPLNARATNDYRDRTCVMYLSNRFMNPMIKNFFIQQGIEVDEDKYALSEMIQFIWRSAIRDGKPINLYIPSKRMRDLLKEWLKGGTTNKGGITDEGGTTDENITLRETA